MWMNWTSLKETLWLSLQKMRMAGGQQKGMDSEASCQALILKSFDEKKPQPSDFTSILLLKTISTQGLLQLTKGIPIIMFSTTTSQEITNWPCFSLPCSCLILLFSWPTLSENTIFTPEGLGLACFGTVLPQHTLLPAAFQSLVILGGKSCPDLNSAKGKDPRSKCSFSRMEDCPQPAWEPPLWSQQPRSLPWIPFSLCTGHAGIFDRGWFISQGWKHKKAVNAARGEHLWTGTHP